jgi:hypothetical protein
MILNQEPSGGAGSITASILLMRTGDRRAAESPSRAEHTERGSGVACNGIRRGASADHVQRGIGVEIPGRIN